MEKIKISILVPIYNVDKYLEQCLESLVNQTIKEIEIICINDGSTDNSLSIIKKYQNLDERVVLINKENTGYGHSMNLGLSTAKGKYIGILESDDYAEVSMFLELYELAEKNNLNVVGGLYYEHKENSHRKIPYIREALLDKGICVQENMGDLLAVKAIWSKIYRRDFLFEKNIKFLETPSASYQDISFNYKVYYNCEKMYISSKAYVHYRMDNPNSSVNSKEKVYAVVEEIEEVFKATSEKDRTYAYGEMLSVYIYNYHRVGQKHKQNFLERMLEDFKAQNLGIEKEKLSAYNSQVYNIFLRGEIYFKLLVLDFKFVENELKQGAKSFDNLKDELEMYTQVVVYGAGKKSEYPIKHLSHFILAETKSDRENIKSIFDISPDENTAVFITPDIHYASDMLETVLKMGFSNIYYLQNRLYQEFLSE